MRHVILGAGTAGLTAAETLRAQAPDADILVVGDELDHPYVRSELTRLIAGERVPDGLHRHLATLCEKGIRFQQGRAAKLDMRRSVGQVQLAEGARVPFDRLLIATGATPRLPALPGIELPGVHCCWTLFDVERLLLELHPRMKIVLIGGGMLGLRVMEALAWRGVEVVLVEQHSHILPHHLSPRAAQLLEQWCRRKGVQIHTATRAVAIAAADYRREGSRLLVQVSGKGEARLRALQADLVICCTGVQPDIGFLKGSSVRCAGGVLVNDRMQTNLHSVYAAGACTESQRKKRIRPFARPELRLPQTTAESNAAEQGHCAALNMAGRHATQERTLRTQVVQAFGLSLHAMGQSEGVQGGRWVEYLDVPRWRYLRLEFQRDVLVGAQVAGFASSLHRLRILMRDRVHLGNWLPRLLENPLQLEEAFHSCTERCHVERASVFHAPSGMSCEPPRHIA